MAATTPRKAAPRKAPAAAVAARREVRAEKGKPKPLAVPFRGETFLIARDKLGSARFFMRQKAIAQFGATADTVVEMLFELLGKDDSARFIETCGPGDNIYAVGTEFIAALNKAGNAPNS